MHLSKETYAKIRQIEIQTRRLLSGSLVGHYSCAQKGFGLEFDQVRDYQPGDDVRFIDWNSSARSNKILIKQYIEERNRTIFLLVDCSASTFFGSSATLKSEVIAQVAAVLALVADYGKDHIGAILFADQVLEVIPPAQSRAQVHTIMERVFTQKPRGTTSIAKALDRLRILQKRSAVVFIISDFIDTHYERSLKIIAQQHEVIAIKCSDVREKTIPFKGFLNIQDPETGQRRVLRTGTVKLDDALQLFHRETDELLRRHSVETVQIDVAKPFIPELIRFFRQRMRY